MLGSDAQSSGLGRIAALFAIVAVVALLAVGAHAHDEVAADAQSCAVCSVAQHSAAPTPTQPLVAAPTARVPLVEPAARVLASQFDGALPIARAPPLPTPHA